MTGPYHYTPAIWPSVLTVLLLVALSVYAWQRRSVPGALVFAVACLIAAPWAAGSAMELAAVDVECKIFWFKFQAVWILPAATAAACFALEYAWPGRWLTRRNLALLSVLPLLVLAMILTNDLHHLIWRGFAYDGTVIPLRGLGNLILLAYGYGLGIVNLVVFAWLFLRSPQHRWPVVIMLTGCIVGRMLYLLEATQALSPGLPIDVPPIAFEYLIYAIALFGFRIFDPIPLARRALIQQLHSGILVLDSQGRVASLNPAAERILGVTTNRARGQPVRELLPACPDGQLAGAEETEIELSVPAGHSLERTPETCWDGVEAGQAVRHYTLEASVLKDWRGLDVGRLLLLHDVSEQKRAQAQILEQQQVVATLQERERLARELHDNLGQVLAYVSMQAQAIRKRARDGDLAAIEPQLTRLAEVAQEAHQEIRESILGLRSSPAEPWSFFSALKQHLDACREHYGLRTELAIPAGLRQDVLGPGAGVQLLRVIQEAVANARKHGRAQCVQVSFGLEDRSVRITVADDGCGFDLEQLEDQAKGHYGLSFMRERMAQIGGSLMLDSRPGSGTQVTLHAPVRSESRSESKESDR